jgi:hypothetical protein
MVIEVALEAVTVSVEALPAVIEVGFAVMPTVGAAVPPPVMVTVAVAFAVPWGPVAVTV